MNLIFFPWISLAEEANNLINDEVALISSL